MACKIFYDYTMPPDGYSFRTYICDSITDQPSSGMTEGDLCIVKGNPRRFFIASSSTTWEEKGVAGSGDMLKSVYDSDEDGDIAEAQLQLNYPTHSNVQDHAQNSDTDLDASFKATLATTTLMAAHTASATSHGAGTIAGLADIVTHAALTTVHSLGTASTAASVSYALTTTYAAHTASATSHGAGTIAGKADITDTGLITTDVTTNDVTSTKHGFAPKSPANTGLFLNGGATPAWSAPPGGTGILTTVYTTATQAFSSTALTNVTGLNFACASTTIYHYKFVVMHKTGTATVGMKWSTTYPASTIAAGRVSMVVTASGTTAYFHGLISASGTAVTGTSQIAADTIGVAIIEGIVRATAAGSIQLQAAAETAGTVWVMDNSVGLLYAIA